MLDLRHVGLDDLRFHLSKAISGRPGTLTVAVLVQRAHPLMRLFGCELGRLDDGWLPQLGQLAWILGLDLSNPVDEVDSSYVLDWPIVEVRGGLVGSTPTVKLGVLSLIDELRWNRHALRIGAPLEVEVFVLVDQVGILAVHGGEGRGCIPQDFRPARTGHPCDHLLRLDVSAPLGALRVSRHHGEVLVQCLRVSLDCLSHLSTQTLPLSIPSLLL